MILGRFSPWKWEQCISPGMSGSNCPRGTETSGTFLRKPQNSKRQNKFLRWSRTLGDRRGDREILRRSFQVANLCSGQQSARDTGWELPFRIRGSDVVLVFWCYSIRTLFKSWLLSHLFWMLRKLPESRLISFTNFNAQFLYSLTMCMLHYNPRHV